MKKLLAFIILLIIGVFGAWKYIDSVILQPLSYDTPIIFEISKGMSARKTAEKLEKENLVPHFVIAQLAMRFFGFDKSLKAGEYLLEAHMSLKDILQKLTSGKVIMHTLTLPEGLTTAQMLSIITRDAFLSGEITEPVSEGEMLPETYTFAKGELRDNIIKKAKSDMKQTLDKIWESRDENLPLQSKEEMLILASIIEKETGVNAERGLVASVFYNRLKMDMPLQTDPTVIYALTLGRSDLGRSLKHQDLEIQSPYNTYIHKGLPPTPICGAGVEALEAAAHPAKSPYLYFVADGNGGHRFAETLSEHNKNIKLWLKK